MIIQADGTVEPCCYWTAHGNANPPLGNINKSSIEEIWNGEGYRRLRQNMAAGDLAAAGCANCFALKQGQALALEYDEDCEKPEYRGTPYADNIRILKDEVSRGANVLTAKPTILSVTMSHKCNLACLHCYQNSSRDRHWVREQAWDEVSALIPTMVRLIAGGGEPLLLSHWRKFIAEFDPETTPLLNFAMTTNATVVKPEVLDGLKHFKSLHIIVSLDGANSRVYDKIRVNGSFHRGGKEYPRPAGRSRRSAGYGGDDIRLVHVGHEVEHRASARICALGRGARAAFFHSSRAEPALVGIAGRLQRPGARDARLARGPRRGSRRFCAPSTPRHCPSCGGHVQKLKGRASRQAWPFFQALDEFIPWDLAFSKHYRVRLRIPDHALAEAKRLWPREKIVFVVWSAVEWSGKRTPVTYHALDRGRLFRGEFPGRRSFLQSRI